MLSLLAFWTFENCLQDCMSDVHKCHGGEFGSLQWVLLGSTGSDHLAYLSTVSIKKREWA